MDSLSIYKNNYNFLTAMICHTNKTYFYRQFFFKGRLEQKVTGNVLYTEVNKHTDVTFKSESVVVHLTRLCKQH